MEERSETGKWADDASAPPQSVATRVAVAALDALTCLRERAEREPERLPAWFQLAGALGKAGRDAEALAVYDAALRHHPGDSDLLEEKARTLTRLGRTGEAQAILDGVVATARSDTTTRQIEELVFAQRLWAWARQAPDAQTWLGHDSERWEGAIAAVARVALSLHNAALLTAEGTVYLALAELNRFWALGAPPRAVALARFVIQGFAQRLTRTLARCDAALAAAPDDPSWNGCKSVTLFLLERYDEMLTPLDILWASLVADQTVSMVYTSLYRLLTQQQPLVAARLDPRRYALSAPPLTAVALRARMRELARAHGLGARVEALDALCAYSIRLAATPLSGEQSPLGASRIGGQPDLPDDLPWPQGERGPLTFVAQLALDELAGYDVERALPASGLLYAFTDGAAAPQRGRLLYYDGPRDRLARAEAPARESAPFRPCALACSAAATLPPPDDPAVETLLPDADERARYLLFFHALRRACGDRERAHQLLGPAETFQTIERDDAPISPALRAQGREARVEKLSEDEREAAQEWRLLLQLDSDELAGMSWADGGLVAYWIARADLAARRFERAALDIQEV